MAQKSGFSKGNEDKMYEQVISTITDGEKPEDLIKLIDGKYKRENPFNSSLETFSFK